MLRCAILVLGLVTPMTGSIAAETVDRLGGDDVAVLAGAARDRCLNDGAWDVVLSDEPESRLDGWHLPDELHEREFGAQLKARAKQRSLWPLAPPCKNVSLVSGARIRAFFAKDIRVPAGWEGFEEEFGGRLHATVTRPAYSADRMRAVLVFTLHSGAMCGGGSNAVEMTRAINGWRVLRYLDR